MRSIDTSKALPLGVQSLHLPSRMQEEMILSTAADPLHLSYIETYHFNTGQPVDAVRLSGAVHRVADKHAILRSIFANNTADGSMQVHIAVLSQEVVQQQAQLLLIPPASARKQSQFVAFKFVDLAIFESGGWNGSMPWKLSLTELPDRSEWCITLSYHHSLMDGWSARSVMAWIRQEMLHPGSVKEASDFFETDRELGPLRCRQIQTSLEERLRYASAPAPLGQDSQGEPTKGHEIVHRVSTRFTARPDQAAVPAWLARLALSITLCTFQNATEAVFLEMTSGRKNLNRESQTTVGPVLVPQIRAVSLGENDSLGPSAQSLRSSRDISHAFSVGELKSLVAASNNPLQVCLVCQTNESYPSNSIGDWEWAGVDTESDLPFVVETMPSQGASFLVKIRYHQPIFNPEFAREFLKYFCRTIEWLEEVQVEIDSWRLTEAITKLTAVGDYAKTYTQMARKESPPNNICAHNLIDQTAERWPNKIALQFEHNEFMTYAELARRSTQLANILRTRLSSDQQQLLVPICFDKSLDMVVTILAVLKAGAAYVPLDPSHPKERMEAILNACRSPLVLWGSLECPSSLDAACNSLGIRLVTNDQLSCLDKTTPEADGRREQLASSLAYVLFTSGSTGTPKGVMVEHRNLVAFMIAGEGNADGMWTSTRLQLAAYTFDASIGDLFANLWQGGRLALVPRNKMLSNLNYWLEETCASHIALTPTVGDLILPNMPARLQTFMFGGEAFHRSFLTQAPPEAKIWNTCGPTETVVDVACCVLDLAKPQATPIGRPMGGCRVYIVRPETNAALPPQAAGEICVAGPQVSRGYLGRGELTARVFISDPFCQWSNGRMYRTGDLGKLNADGKIEHMGRIDGQVKLRGLRVETGEVETVIKQSSAALTQVCVDVHHSVSGQDILVAWLASTDTQGLERARRIWKQEVLIGCQRHLANYMIPGASILVSKLPLTQSAKLDRRALNVWFEHIERGISLAGVFPISAPGNQAVPLTNIAATEREKIVAARCAATLSIDSKSISMDSTFISLGGNSLQAMRLLASLRREGVHCSLAQLLGAITLGELATEVPSDKPESQDVVQGHHQSFNLQGWDSAVENLGIPPQAVESIYPCTPLQEGLISTTLQTNSSAYVANMTIRLGEVLDQQRFQIAWQAVVCRHSILRTVFISSGGVEDHQAIEHSFFQVVLRASCGEVHRVLSMQTAAMDFMLGRIPLSCRLTRAEAGGWRLQLTMHHVLYDEAYLSWLVTELSLEYERDLANKVGLLSPTSPFANFACSLHPRTFDKTKEFWRSYLDGAEPAAWPIAGGLHTTDAGKGILERHTNEWKGDVSHMARALQVTPAAVIRAALAITIAEYSDAEDVVIGEVSSGRVDHESFVLGPCVATHPVRIHVDRGAPSWLRSVASRALQDYLKVLPHQHYGLANIRKVSPNPDLIPFQTLFVHQEAYDQRPQRNVAFKLDSIDLGSLGFPLVIESRSSHETGNVTIECSFDQTRISRTNVDWVIRHFCRALDLLSPAAEPAGSTDIPTALLDREEQDVLADWSKNPEEPLLVSPDAAEKLCIHEVADAQARQTPDKIAVQVDYDTFITFGQLKERSDHVAHALTGRLAVTYWDLPADRQPIVPICFDKGADMVVAMLAVLKTGAVWVPIDRNHPRDRIENIVRQAEARLFLDGTSGPSMKLYEVAEATESVLVNFNDLAQARGALTARAPFRYPTPASLAYLLFTSGSTGTPKGVMVEHRNVVAFTLANETDLMGTWTAVRFQLAAYTFDAAVLEVFTPLCTGGRLVLSSSSDVVSALPEWLEQTSTTHLFITPRAAGLLADRIPPHLRTLAIGGEAFDISILPRVPQECQVFNVFGPTESTVFATKFAVEGQSVAQRSVPIGQSYGASRIYILRPDSATPVAIGAVGEICVAGPQVARGYLNRPEATTKAFIENPYQPQERLYRTGDLGRFCDPGVVEYVGRMDGQIKLRGLRIETAEIESICLRHAQVIACAVIVLNRTEGDVLIGFFQVDALQATRDSTIQGSVEEQLNALLSDHVPGYMIPSRLIATQQIPVTSHGKADRRALQSQAKALDQEGHLLRADAGGNFTLVKGSLEDQVADVWSRALGIDKTLIGPDVAFARLGGDSIRAIRLLSMLRAAGFDLNIVDVGNQSTIISQAQKASLNQKRPSTQPVVRPDDPTELGWTELGPIAAMYAALQRRATDLHENRINHFNQSVLLDVTGNAPERLQSALAALQVHHDMLRVVVDWDFAYPVSEWKMKALPSSQIVPLTLSPPMSMTRDSLRSQIANKVRGLNIKEGKVMDAALYKEHGSDRVLLFWTIHHFVVDIVSWQLLLQDFNMLLGAMEKQTSLQLQPTLTSFPKWTLACKKGSLRSASPASNGHIGTSSQRSQAMTENYPLWLQDPSHADMNSYTRTKTTAKVGETLTRLLLGPANEILGTEPLDILLTAMGMTVGQLWKNELSQLEVGLETHGRHALQDTIDISRTVGWFTAILPILLDCSRDWSSIEKLVRHTKDRRTLIMQKNEGFRRFVDGRWGSPTSTPAPFSLVLNYQGVKEDPGCSGEEAVRVADVQGLEWQDTSDDAVPLSFAWIEVFVQGKETHMECTWPGETGVDFVNVAAVFAMQVESICRTLASRPRCSSPLVTGSSISAFGLVSEGCVDRIYESFEGDGTPTHRELEDIVPCTPMQRALVFEGIAPSAACPYITSRVWNLAPGQASIVRVQEAVKTLVRRHEVLRTRFLVDTHDGPVSLVFKPNERTMARTIGKVEVQNSTQVTAEVNAIMKNPQLGHPLLQPFFARILYSTGANEAQLVWRLHHSLVDAWSQDIIIRELAQLLVENKTEGVMSCRPSFGSFARFVSTADLADDCTFWAQSLADYDPVPIPASFLSPNPELAGAIVIEQTCDLQALSRRDVSPAALLSLAWSVVLSEVLDADDVIHGMLFSGRNVPVADVENIAGPCITTVPIRKRIQRGESVEEALRQTERFLESASKHSKIGVAGAAKSSGIEASKLVTTLLNFYGARTDALEDNRLKSALDACTIDDGLPPSVTLSCWRRETDDNVIVMRLEQRHLLEPCLAKHLMNRLAAYCCRLSSVPDATLHQTISSAADEQACLISWSLSPGPAPPKESYACIHDLVTNQARIFPGKVALQFEDSEFMTYGELEQRSAHLARSIRQVIGRPWPSQQPVIPICFDRSIDMVIAILGVLKAGAAFVPLNSSDPAGRLQSIVRTSNSPFIIAAKVQCEGILQDVASATSTVPYTISQLSKMSGPEQLPAQESSSLAYVLFTSGSTGEPKGVMIEHRNVTSFIASDHEEIIGRWSTCRMPVAAYTFDVSMADLLTGLAVGARVALVHSQKLLASMSNWSRKVFATTLSMTPSLASLLKPTIPVYLQTLLLAGETFEPAIMQVMKNECRVWNGYGPTETFYATFHHVDGAQNQQFVPIGRPYYGNRVYLLHPDTPERVPIGAVGEICVCGTQVARGYFARPGLTADKFTSDPFESHGFMYRTGDLGRFHSDGSIEFLGRKDGQVKIRGQRTETAEIESIISRSSAEISRSAVEHIQQGVSGANLTAVIVVTPDISRAQSIELVESVIKPVCHHRLPSHMVPTTWISMDTLPLTTSGKTDKRKLASWIKKLVDGEEVQGGWIVSSRSLNSVQGELDDIQSPANEIEIIVREACASLLGQGVTSISMASSFVALGGDSLLALQLNARLKEEGLMSTPRAILQAESIATLANLTQPLGDTETQRHVESMDLEAVVAWSDSETAVWKEAAQHAGFGEDQIQLCMPCTPLQEGVLSSGLAGGKIDGYLAVLKVRLGTEVDIQGIQHAWSTLVSQEDMLRTAFVLNRDTGYNETNQLSSFLQIVLRPGCSEVKRVMTLDMAVTTKAQLEGSKPHQSLKTDLHFGGIPLSALLTKTDDDPDEEFTLELAIHHASYDEAYLSALLTRLSILYRDIAKAPISRPANPGPSITHRVPFSKFVRFLCSKNSSATVQFWKDHLGGAQPASWPVKNGLQRSLDSIQEPVLKQVHWTGRLRSISTELHVTPAAVVRAAVALTLAEHADSSDVVIGEVSNGQPDVESQGKTLQGSFISGPCATTHPVRLRLDNETGNNRCSLQELVRRSFSTYLDCLAHQHCGLTRIREQCDRADLLPFQVLFVYQEAFRKSEPVAQDATFQVRNGKLGHMGFPLVIACTREEGDPGASFHCSYAPEVVDGVTVDWFLYHITQALDAIARAVHTQSAAAETSSQVPAWISPGPEEIRQLDRWSRTDSVQKDQAISPCTIDQTFMHTALKMRNKIALQFEQSGWITYGELDDRSSQVSMALRQRLVTRVDHTRPALVPICYDRSVDMVVAILAVLKAGAAYAPLDPNHPGDRLATIVRKTKSNIMLAGTAQRNDKVLAASRSAGADLITLADLDKESSVTPVPDQRHGTSSIAVVLFTSGSTGQPKGVMIEHRNLMSFLRHNRADGTGTWRSSRFPISSYTFDLSMADMLVTLCIGGRVVLVPEQKLLPSLSHWVEICKATHLTMSFTLARLLCGAFRDPKALSHLSVLVLAGEAFDMAILNDVPDQCRVYNAYGPTETVVYVTLHRVHKYPTLSTGTAPIGGPFGANAIYLLRPESTSRVPLGAVGEICIAGDQVSQGYLEQPDVTERHFHPNVVNPSHGRVLYRTGDLGRYNSSGHIEYLGRQDAQVKVRGQRVELNEIEAVLLEHELVKGAIVVVVDAPTGAGLLSFCLLDTNQVVDSRWEEVAAGLRAHVANRLPVHMVPSLFTKLEGDFPRGSTGKVDRRALSSTAQELAAAKGLEQETKYVAPTTQTEAIVCEVFGEVLSRQVGVTDSFLDLGGHSVLAIRAVSKINQRLRSRVSLMHVFDAPTPRGLAKEVDSMRATKQYTAIPHVPRNQDVEQSFAQSRLWFLEQLHPGSASYLMPIGLRTRGKLQLDALEQALQSIERRHETLRTTFESRDGCDIQVVHPLRARRLRVIENPAAKGETAVLAALKEEQARPFNIECEPGWRVSIFRLSPEEHIISIVIHHIISDGWSIGVVLSELQKFYSGAIRGEQLDKCLEPLPIQYRDFAIWQKQEDQAAEHERQLGYWVKKLAGSQPAQLLLDRPRPQTMSGNALFEEVKLECELYQALSHFCSQYQTTPFIVLLAAFRVAHYRLTGATDATIGTPIANRGRAELEGLIGLFVNVQCIRSQVDDTDSFEVLVKQIQSTAHEAFAHQDVPFERIVSVLQPTRDVSRNPLVQTVFAVHPKTPGQGKLGDLETENILLAQTSRMDLEVHLFHEDEGLQGQVIFARDLFVPETIRALVSTFYAILDCGLREPKAPLRSMTLMNDTGPLHNLGLLDVKRTAYPRDSSLVDVFREQVALHPGKLAVCDNNRRITYQCLEQESDKIAAWLVAQSLAPETLVAVFGPRCVETVIAIIGILKASLAYLPLDSKTTEGRLRSVFSCIENRLLVLTGPGVQSPMLPELGHVQFQQISTILTTQEHELSEPGTIERTSPSANSLAYIMFTSGSTGKPKGVMIEHRGVIRLVKNCNFVSAEHHGKPVAHMANISFDVSTWEIYFALLNGGALVCVDAMTSLDSAALKARFVQEQVRVAMFTPALFKSHLRESPATIQGLEVLVLGGDKLDVQDVSTARELVQGEIVNGYGPTENTGASAIYRIPPQEQCLNGVPIGEAIHNSGIYVMDHYLRLVPPGVIGELVVTGDGLARGYTDKRRDESCFVTIDINGQSTRAYRTGDYGRWRPVDGQLEYFGRQDNQVKIRGHRVELGEIEHCAKAHESVKDAVAVVQGFENEQSQLAVFVTHSGATDNAVEDEQVEAWKDIFDAETYDGIADMAPDKLGRDFTGWLSMYDGSVIDSLAMEEWLDDTVESMLNGHHPRRILEIGTGSGMILFNIATGLEKYMGVEAVPKLAAAIQQRADSHEELNGKVRLHAGTADQILALCGDFDPSLVVVNSVAQYFPSADYLFQLVQDLLQLRGVETLFFGDMRSYALYNEFLVSKALHTSGARASMAQICQVMAETEEMETELLVDPAFFTSLVSRLPDKVEHVEILPKRMAATNELSCYRYAAVIHLKCGQGERRHIYHIKDEDWVDFTTENLSSAAITHRLREAGSASPVAIANIPHRKTILEKRLAGVLASTSCVAQSQNDWQIPYRNQSAAHPGLTAIDLERLGRRAGFQVEVSWARQHSQGGGLDAIFHRFQPTHCGQRVLFDFPTDHQNRPLGSFSNHPVCTQLHRKVQSELRQSLRSQLPSYMVPHTITILDHMPLTDRGKVDRQLLSRQVQRSQKMSLECSTPSDSPKATAIDSRIERLVCEVFEDILGAKVSPTESFFALGGHSLLVPRAASMLSKRLDHRVTVRDIFDCPTPASLARRFEPTEAERSTGSGRATPEAATVQSLAQRPLEWQQAVEAWGLCADDVVEVNPCTPFQAGVLSNGMAAAHSTNSSYLNIMRLGLPAEQIDSEALQVAWHETVCQEDMLRTAFVPCTADAGTCVGIASDAFLQAVLKVASSEGQRLLQIPRPGEQPSTPSTFDFGQIPVSLGLVWAGDGSGLQAEVAIHHALYDEAYISWLLAKLSHNYHHARTTSRGEHTPMHTFLDATRVPFSEFVSQLRSQEYTSTAAFWRSYLDSAPVASWPIAGGLEIGRSAAGGVWDTRSVEWTGDIRALAGQRGVTAAAIARAAVALVVAEHSGENEAILGEVSSGRSLVEGSGFVAGPCIATHPVRVQLQGRSSSGTGHRASLEEVAKHALDSYLETLPNQHLGLSSIRRQTGTPDLLPFQVLFAYQQPLGLPATKVQGCNYFTIQDGKSGQSEFPLSIEASCLPVSGHVYLRCTYDPVALPAEDVAQLLNHITQVLDAMDQRPTSPALLTVSPEEGNLLHQLSTCPDSQPSLQLDADVCAHDLIHRQALKTPDKIAIQCELTGFLTYSELDQQSSALAGAIRSFHRPHRDAGPHLIPISFDKGVDMLVAILGVLKAGAAYVPLDASHPEARLRAVCESANAQLILWDGLSGNKTLHAVARTVGASLLTMGELPVVPNETSVVPAKQGSSSFAYVIYTSGSTGTPKGVMVTHRNLVTLMTSRCGADFVAWTDSRLQLCAHTFDASVCDLFCPLGAGGRVCLVRQEQVWTGLAEWAEALMVNTLLTTPSVADTIAPGLGGGHFARLRTLMLGGEPIQRSLLEKCPRELAVWNRYGPTEATVDVIACRLHGPGTADGLIHRPFLPIGRPIRDNRIYLLRPGTEDLVPIGVPGEICIAGPQVAHGYRGRDDLTATGFPADPFADAARMYRTGDWGRRHADGMIEFRGRIDHQVKLHGLRMELGEIESAMRTCRGVKACVVVKVDWQGNEMLVACVEGAVGEGSRVLLVDADHDEDQGGGEEVVVDEETVREHVSQRVPGYMVPTHIHVQTTPLPRTVNDKLDRREIADRATQIAEHRGRSASRARRPARPGSLEARIASCWARNLALDEEELDVGAPFAQLGGDSIRAIGLLALLRREGLRLYMADCRPSATIEMQAARLHLQSRSREVPSHLHMVARPGNQATMVWIHPLFGQSSVFDALVPALDPRYNVILISDPFFGTPQGPPTLRDWAAHYLQDLEPLLVRHQPLALAGYSFGGLLAMEMASLWREKHGAPPSSLIVVDARPHEPATPFFRDAQERREAFETAVKRLGGHTMPTIHQHFDKHERIWSQSCCPPVYNGRGLFVATPQSHAEGVVAWWQAQCPEMGVRDVHCSHGAIFNPEMVGGVSEVINEHCDLRQLSVPGTSDGSASESDWGAGSKSDTADEGDSGLV